MPFLCITLRFIFSTKTPQYQKPLSKALAEDKIMDDEIFQKVLKVIEERSITLDLLSYVIIAVVSLVSGLIGAFGASYIKEKGKNYATKEDFDALLEQTKLTTHETEAIKASIGKSGWRESKQWELRYTIYTEILQSLAEWRIALTRAHVVLYENDGSAKKELTEEDNNKIRDATQMTASVLLKLAKIEAISEMVLSNDKAERVRNLVNETVQSGRTESGRESFERAVETIVTLEKELSQEAKEILFANSG